MPRSDDLGDQLENFVTTPITSDCHASGDGVLRDSAQPIKQREAQLASLDEAIAKGIQAADEGNARPSSAVFARLEAKYRALADSAG